MSKEVAAGASKLEAVAHRAYENYVLELARGISSELEKHDHYKRSGPQILEIQLAGEYPDTCLRILKHDPIRDVKRWSTHSLWNVHTFFPEQNYSGSPVRMVSDILRYARAEMTQPVANLSADDWRERNELLREEFAAVTRRAFERRVLHLVQDYGPLQDGRFRDAHDNSIPAAIFLRAELDGEHPETGVTVHTYDRAQDQASESRHPIWDPEFAESDAANLGHMLPPERIADEILIRARDPELRDLTAASASGTEWRERYAAVERRAFEVHVFDLIQGHSSLEDGQFRDLTGNTLIFLWAELVGEYPKAHIVIYLYDQERDLEIKGGYPIWRSDYADGDVADVEHMRRPGWIADDIMMLARGTHSSPTSRFK